VGEPAADLGHDPAGEREDRGPRRIGEACDQDLALAERVDLLGPAQRPDPARDLAGTRDARPAQVLRAARRERLRAAVDVEGLEQDGRDLARELHVAQRLERFLPLEDPPRRTALAERRLAQVADLRRRQVEDALPHADPVPDLEEQRAQERGLPHRVVLGFLLEGLVTPRPLDGEAQDALLDRGR
jgi:hypothetical protein